MSTMTPERHASQSLKNETGTRPYTLDIVLEKLGIEIIPNAVVERHKQEEQRAASPWSGRVQHSIGPYVVLGLHMVCILATFAALLMCILVVAHALAGSWLPWLAVALVLVSVLGLVSYYLRNNIDNREVTIAFWDNGTALISVEDPLPLAVEERVTIISSAFPKAWFVVDELYLGKERIDPVLWVSLDRIYWYCIAIWDKKGQVLSFNT